MRRNIHRAGAEERVFVHHGDFRDLDRARLEKVLSKQRLLSWPESIDVSRGLVIANPPYGERLKSARGRTQDLDVVYTELRDFCRGLGRGWRAAFIVANDAFEGIFGQKPLMKKPIWNGSIRAWFLLYSLD
jgi:23S rRNA G2445 N2-methylase RlmL